MKIKLLEMRSLIEYKAEIDGIEYLISQLSILNEPVPVMSVLDTKTNKQVIVDKTNINKWGVVMDEMKQQYIKQSAIIYRKKFGEAIKNRLGMG